MNKDLNSMMEVFTTHFETPDYSKYTQIPIKHELNISEYLKPGHFKDLYDELYIEGWFVPISLINFYIAGGGSCPYILFLKLYNVKKTHQNNMDMCTNFYVNAHKQAPTTTLMENATKIKLKEQIKNIDGTLLCDVLHDMTSEHAQLDDIIFTDDDIEPLKIPDKTCLSAILRKEKSHREWSLCAPQRVSSHEV